MNQLQETLDFGLLENTIGQGTELADVLFAGKRLGTERMRVGDGQLIHDDRAIGQGDLHTSAKRLLRRVNGVVALGPVGILAGGGLVPQCYGVGTLRALGGVTVNVVPRTILQRHREDIRNRVIQSLTARVGVILLRIICAGTDDVVRVV